MLYYHTALNYIMGANIIEKILPDNNLGDLNYLP